MATLAANVKRDYGLGAPEVFGHVNIIADDIVFEGAAVGESSSTGTFRPLVAGDVFGGFAARKCDNSGGAASAKQIRVRRQGYVDLTVASTTPGIDDEGETVYASDDDTFTTVSTSNTAIGKIVKHVSGSVFTVFFQAAALQSL